MESKLGSAVVVSNMVGHLPECEDRKNKRTFFGNQSLAFYLTDTEDLQQRYATVKKQFEDSGVDAVVHNDMKDISSKAHPFCLHTPMQKPVPCRDAEVLARTINNLMEAVS